MFDVSELIRYYAAMRPPNLSKIVKDRMEAKGLTMYALAQQAKLNRQTVGNFLNGGHALQSDKLAALFGVLDLIVIPKEEEAK